MRPSFSETARGGSTQGEREHRWQDALDRPQPPVEPQLTQVDNPFDRLRADAACAGERRDCDAEIEPGTVLRERSRREVDRDFTTGQRASRVRRGGTHPILGLAERCIR